MKNAKFNLVVCVLLTVHFSVAFDKVFIDERTLEPGKMAMFEAYQALDLERSSAMTGVDLRIVSLNGEELDIPTEIFFHHFIAYSPSRVSTTCPEMRTPGGYITSFGEELIPVRLPHPYTLYLHPGESLYGNYMVQNPNHKESITFRLEVIFHFSDNENGLIPVEGIRMIIPGCLSPDSAFDVPASKSGPVEVHRDYQSTFSGTIVWLALHTHDGALNGTLTSLDSGKVLFASTMHYDDPEDDTRITSFDAYSPMVRVKIREHLRLAVTYTGEGHLNAMATFMGYSTITAQGHHSHDRFPPPELLSSQYKSLKK